MITRLMMTVAALLALTPAAPLRAQPRQVVYVSVSKDNKVLVFDLDATSGALTQRQSVEPGAGPAPLAVSPDKRFMYVALRNKEAATLAIDEKTGGLALLSRTLIDAGACYVSTDRTGRYLFAADYAAGKVNVHRIGDDGVVIAGPVQTVKTDRHAHCVHPDVSNRFVFVPHTGPSAIYQFRFDAQTGLLSPNDPPMVVAPDGAGPRHYRFHPTLAVLYAINELDSSMTAYHFDRQRGTLTQFQNLPTLPPDFAEKNTCAEVQVTPDGRFVYGSNRGHDSIVGYAVDPANGGLTLIDRFPTEKTPRVFATDATGQFLYAAGLGSGNVAAYRIDDKTGRLSRVATYEVGPAPSWVEVLALPTRSAGRD